MKKPNFFIAGQPRSGTTALFRFLNQHPEIYMCESKEPYYFCTDFHEESDQYHKKKLRFPIRTEKQYLQLFKDAVNEKIIGEATPDYLFSKNAAKNICAFNREAKILISIRNPVDLLYSLHSQMLFYGGEDVEDFKKALEMEPARKECRNLPRGLLWPSSLYYSERIQFCRQIKIFLDCFSGNRVKIIIFDDFIQDNLKICRQILEFLDVDTGFIPDLKVYNPQKVVRFKLVNFLFAAIGDLPLKNLMPYKVRGAITRKIRKLNIKDQKSKPLDPVFRRMLMEKIRPEVEELSRLTNRDLMTLWGFDKI